MENYTAQELGDLTAYLGAWEEPPPVENIGLSAAENGPAPAPAAPVPPKRISVLTVQKLYNFSLTRPNGPKGKKLKPDGLWGPNTKRALTQLVQIRRGQLGGENLPPLTIKRLNSRTILIPGALADWLQGGLSELTKKGAIVAPIKKAPKKRPTDAPKSGMTKANVGQIQDLLRRLGVEVMRDGLWGPKTATSYMSAARRRKLDPAMGRAGPSQAWIVPATWAALTKEAGVAGAEPEGQPISAKPVKPAKEPEPGGIQTFVAITPAELGLILRAFKKKPLGAAELPALWAALAAEVKKPPQAQITPKGLEVVPATKAALVKVAKVRESIKLLVAASTVPVAVKTIQEGMKFVNETTQKGKLSRVRISGAWDGPTADGFFLFFAVPPANIPLWEQALKQTVGKDRKSVRLPNKFAIQAATAAQEYKRWRLEIDRRETVRKAQASKIKKAAAAREAKVAAAVGKSRNLVSIFALQQALNEARARQQAGTFGGPTLPVVQLTGRWNPATDTGLWTLFGTDIWGSPTIDEGSWATLLKNVLVQGKSNKSGLGGLYGLYGGLAAAPTAANFIKLPAPVAAQVQSLAADFLLRSVKKGEMMPADAEIPIPGGGSMQVDLPPQLVLGRPPPTVQVPQMVAPPVPEITPPAPRRAPPPLPMPAPMPQTVPAVREEHIQPHIVSPDGDALPPPQIQFTTGPTRVEAPIIHVNVPPQIQPAAKNNTGLLLLGAAVAVGAAVALKK